MKLSTAIRIGSLTTKQITHKFTDGGNGRCALGAAVDATGAKLDAFNWVEQAATTFPILDTPGLDLLMEIVSMNDHRGKTREEIADWVQGIEDAQEATGYMESTFTDSKPVEQIAMEAK